jgi:5-azacytidine-induced protein 1
MGGTVAHSTCGIQAKRENWLAEKTKEIKDITIKGLEPEIQSLVQKHRKEIADQKEAHMLDTKRQLDALSEQHNIYVR